MLKIGNDVAQADGRVGVVPVACVAAQLLRLLVGYPIR